MGSNWEACDEWGCCSEEEEKPNIYSHSTPEKRAEQIIREKGTWTLENPKVVKEVEIIWNQVKVTIEDSNGKEITYCSTR